MADSAISIRLEKDGESYKVALSFGSERASVARFEYDVSEVSRTATVARRIDQGICSLDDLRDVGVQLWAGLMAAPNALARLRDTIESSKGDDVVIIELHLPDELEHMPWETLYDDQIQYLACDPRVSLVHVAHSARAVRPAPPPGQALSILVAIPQGADLNVENEWKNIKNAVDKLGGAVELVDLRGVVDPKRLSDQLRSRHWHVVHFVGHGQRIDNSVEVRLNDEGGGELWRRPDQFSALFRGAEVDICVLNCCYGGTTKNVRTLDRLAPSLMTTGVRAVVAMRYAVADIDAICFSNTFYQELLRPEQGGRVGYSAQLARKALLGSSSSDGARSFVTPLVHTLGSDERILHVAQTSPRPQPPLASKVGQIPSRLRDAIAERRCVAVVGTDLVPPPLSRGGSVTAGLWNLIERLVTTLREIVTDDPDQLPSPISNASDQRTSSPDVLLRQVCEHFYARNELPALRDAVRSFYAPLPASDHHRLLASWQMPAIFYTHFDGLMETAYSARDRVTVVKDMSASVEVSSDAVLALVRGTINDYETLVLTEHQHFELTDKIARMHATLAQLAKPRGRQQRCALFVGTSPADPLARQIARKLLEEKVPEVFFVSDRHSRDDEWFWKRFNVRFVRMDTDLFIRTASAGTV